MDECAASSWQQPTDERVMLHRDNASQHPVAVQDSVIAEKRVLGLLALRVEVDVLGIIHLTLF